MGALRKIGLAASVSRRAEVRAFLARSSQPHEIATGKNIGNAQVERRTTIQLPRHADIAEVQFLTCAAVAVLTRIFSPLLWFVYDNVRT